jgi:hypothetical protein
VLTPADQVPPDAIGYAVPIFTTRTEAARFCPLALERVGFVGALTSSTPMFLDTYGETEDVAPFVWPVTAWTRGEPFDCAHLVARYNIAGAQVFLRKARRAIAAHGGVAKLANEDGPFIMTARRACGGVMLYDLSRAPNLDWERWLRQAIVDLSRPSDCRVTVVRPVMRDQVRAFVFASAPSWQGILKILVPGYNPATAAK